MLVFLIGSARICATFWVGDGVRESRDEMELSRRICAALEELGASGSGARGEVGNTKAELCLLLRVRSGVGMDG